MSASTITSLNASLKRAYIARAWPHLEEVLEISAASANPVDV